MVCRIFLFIGTLITVAMELYGIALVFGVLIMVSFMMAERDLERNR